MRRRSRTVKIYSYILIADCCLSQVQLSLLRDCVVVSPPPRNGQMKIIQKKMMGYQSTLAKFYIAAGMAHQASAAGLLFLAEPDLG